MDLLVALASVVFATLPIFAFLFTIWWLDRYDREPWWLVAITFLWGAIGGVTFAMIGSSIVLWPVEALLSPEAADAIGATFVAPLIEEPSKALILLALVRSRRFDNTTDGFVYGAATGLGFGMTENLLYFVSVGASGDYEAFVGTIVIRTLFSAMMHAIASSTVGAALGWGKFRGIGASLVAAFFGLAGAMTIHFLWNGLLTLDGLTGGEGGFTALDFLIFPMEFLFLFVIFQACLWDEQKMIVRELTDEATRGLLPADHLPFLASYLKRNRKSWLAAGIPHDDYVRDCTTLAFRKHQSHRASDRKLYEREIDELRARISQHLGSAS